MRIEPAVVGVAPFVGPPDVQFGRRHLHADTVAAVCGTGQCRVIGLRLLFSYAALAWNSDNCVTSWRWLKKGTSAAPPR